MKQLLFLHIQGIIQIPVCQRQSMDGVVISEQPCEFPELFECTPYMYTHNKDLQQPQRTDSTITSYCVPVS